MNLVQDIKNHPFLTAFNPNFSVIESLELDCKSLTEYCEDHEGIDPIYDYYRYTDLDK